MYDEGSILKFVEWLEYDPDWAATKSRRPITREEYIEEQFYDDQDVLDMLAKHGVVFTNGLEYHSSNPRDRNTRWFKPPSYKTPYDYYRHREGTTVSSTHSLEEELQSRLTELRHHEDRLNETKAQIDQQRYEIGVQIAAVEAALGSYQAAMGTLGQVPSTPAPSELQDLIQPPEVPVEEAPTTTKAKPPTTAKAKVPTSAKVGKKRENLTSKEAEERDWLKHAILASAATQPNPGEITIPEAARATGKLEVYGNKGPKKQAFADAVGELVNERRLEKTDQLVWPYPDRKHPGGIGGRTAVLYKLIQQPAEVTTESPLGVSPELVM